MILYAVPWIEVEYGWGDRPEGYKVFDNLEECISSTKESSANGNYESGGGYCGPVRPLYYIQVQGTIKESPTFVKSLKDLNVVKQRVDIT